MAEDKAWDVGVSAVVVRDGAVIASAHNGPVGLKDPSAHAEILALRRAAEAEGNYRLAGTTLYVTIEPCLMCAGALIHARVSRLVFGAPDPKAGSAGSALNILQMPALNHRCDITAGVRMDECRAVLRSFFQEQRAKPD